MTSLFGPSHQPRQLRPSVEDVENGADRVGRDGNWAFGREKVGRVRVLSPSGKVEGGDTDVDKSCKEVRY